MKRCWRSRKGKQRDFSDVIVLFFVLDFLFACFCCLFLFFAFPCLLTLISFLIAGVAWLRGGCGDWKVNLIGVTKKKLSVLL